MSKVDVYLTFNGQCEEAFTFYASVFGEELQQISRFRDMPPHPGMEIPEEAMGQVMHVSVPVGKESVLMGCDNPLAGERATVMGNNFSLSFSADTKIDADRIFSALSAGGKITMPMATTFWNSYFGMLKDKFGIGWMVSANPE